MTGWGSDDHQLIQVRSQPPSSRQIGAVAECRCGWRSEPKLNSELAHQAWEAHRDRPTPPKTDDPA